MQTDPQAALRIYERVLQFVEGGGLDRNASRRKDTLRTCLFNSGMLLLNSGNPREAEARFGRVLDLGHSPSHGAAHAFYGQALLDLGRVAEAVGTWSATLQESAGDTQVEQIVNSKLADAVLRYTRRLKKRASFDNLLGAGITYLGNGRNDEASRFFSRALKLQPARPGADLHFYAGQAAFRRGRLEEAAALFRAAVPLRPRDANAYRWLSYVEEQLGHKDAALRAQLDGAASAPLQKDTTFLVAGAHRALSSSGRTEEAVAFIRSAVERGTLHSEQQRPPHFVRGISSHAWRDDAWRWRSVRLLEERYGEIRRDVLRAHAAGELLAQGIADTEGLTPSGQWTELNLVHQGRTWDAHLAMLPVTASVLQSLPEHMSMVRGASKVSVLAPGTVLKPHCGPSNTRMRIHLPLLVPKAGPWIRVGAGEPRQWIEGQCLVFDDSYEHESWNAGTEERIVLIVDVWHPDVDDGGRVASLIGGDAQDARLLETYRYRRSQFNDSEWAAQYVLADDADGVSGWVPAGPVPGGDAEKGSHVTQEL